MRDEVGPRPNLLGWTSVALGLLALVSQLPFLCCCSWLSPLVLGPIAIAALVFGALGLRQARVTGDGDAVPLAGLALAGSSLLVSLCTTLFFAVYLAFVLLAELG